jgi:predicted phage terminase large subunit-like protein
MNTRWHERDVAGRVLDQIEKGVVSGRVISIPAIADAGDSLGRAAGEYLWDEPEGYNYADFLRARQREASPMMWSALYQQRPAPEEGDYFKTDWLLSYEGLPRLESLALYGASDYAVTADGGDYTVHIVVGVDPAGRMYVVDLWRRQASSDVWVETFCDLALRWQPREWAEEVGQIRSGVGPFLERRQRDRQAYVFRRQFPTRGDKAVRAQSIRGRMALHGLYLPLHAPWVAEFRRELLTFPAGSHDDQVDALGLIGQLLDHLRSGSEIEPAKKDPIAELLRPRSLNEWLRLRTVDERGVVFLSAALF